MDTIEISLENLQGASVLRFLNLKKLGLAESASYSGIYSTIAVPL